MTDLAHPLVDTVLELHEVDHHRLLLWSSRHDDPRPHKVFLKAGGGGGLLELCPGRHQLMAFGSAGKRGGGARGVHLFVLCPQEDTAAFGVRLRQVVARVTHLRRSDINVDQVLALHSTLRKEVA
jgi:hypothetical protein